jgi:16S rRNA (guanine(966)-N(2))-methyltransferase RsmD
MRIISGKWRGLVLAEFKGDDIRPTADRVKESLFNIIYDRVQGSSCLDLFCGSGNLGIECLSRGAVSVHFNDAAKTSIDVLKKNLARLKGEVSYKITISDYAACLNQTATKYDLIFIDPPYRFDFGKTCLDIIRERNLLNDGGLVIYERNVPFELTSSGWQKVDERKYGITYLTFLQLNGD